MKFDPLKARQGTGARIELERCRTDFVYFIMTYCGVKLTQAQRDLLSKELQRPADPDHYDTEYPEESDA